jgi:mannosyltransferase OCH1-like enzyme
MKIINKEQLLRFLRFRNICRKFKIAYPLKRYFKPIIPLNIYQTWHTKELPPLMLKNSQKIKENNPAFNYQLFDDVDCYNFIKENFDEPVANAYNSLIPGAYKADLWRYCILYINGGIYLDIKYGSMNNFKFINMTESEHFVLDADNNGIYNALLVCLPKNPKLLKAINSIVENVKHKYYGNHCLEITGPLLLKNFFTQSEKNKLDMVHSYYTFDNRFILFNNYFILKNYQGDINETTQFKKVDHYSVLWNKRQVYI